MAASESLVEIPGDPPIFGIFHPAGLVPAKAAVLWLHGWSGNRQGPNRLFVDLARELPGVASLRVDLPGHGETPAGASGVTVDAMIESAVRAAAFLRKHSGAFRIALAGVCSGGNVAMGAATLEAPEGLILLSTPPFREQRQRGSTARRRFRVLLALAGRFFSGGWRRLLRGEANMRAAARYVRGDAPGEGDPRDSARDIPKALSGFRGRVFLAYGTRDTESENGPEAFEALFRGKGCDVGRISIEGANHNFYDFDWRERLRSEIGSWLADVDKFPRNN